jgi:hypothetical protein
MASGFSLLGDESAGAEYGEERALQAYFTAARFIPFLEGMSAAAIAACADGDGVDAERERNVGVSGGAFGARRVCGVIIGCTKSGE